MQLLICRIERQKILINKKATGEKPLYTKQQHPSVSDSLLEFYE